MESLTEIINWAKESLVTKGYTLNNSPEAIQTTPWSSVFRFLTSDGCIYLKRTPQALALEPTITQILHDKLHADVPLILDMNKDGNCFLMRDCGVPLRGLLKKNFQPDLLCQAVRKYTRIQAVSKEYVDKFLEFGVPDWRLEKLPLLYDQLIGKEEWLKADGATAGELRRLKELKTKLASMCSLLASYKISPTLDHCDFHDGNILIEPDTKNITIIDWGEAVIAHPFFSLLTFLNTASRHYSIQETDKIYIDLQNVCFENWHELLSQEQLSGALLLGRKLWSIYAALGLHRLIMSFETEKTHSLAGRLTWYLREFIRLA